MRLYLRAVGGLSRGFAVIGAASLILVMALTILDVILRAFGRPIIGTYEMVALGGGVAIGFSLPFSSWMKDHVMVDFFVSGLARGPRVAFRTATRVLAIGFFALLGWNLLRFGADLRMNGEVSPTLQIPFYPVAWGLGICSFVQCLVLLADILKAFGGIDE